MKSISLGSTFVASAALLAAGCATAPGQSSFSEQIKQTFASEDPCANNARNIGIVGGVVLGAMLGNAMGTGKDESRLIGAALGGVVGGVIGADMDRRRCELSKVAKKYDLEITFASIESAVEVSGMQLAGSKDVGGTHPGNEAVAVIGSSVSVRDKNGVAGHFEAGSDQLTPKAKEYFSEIAAQYAPETIAEAQLDPKRKSEILKQLVKRRILLVGHTDDTGSSQMNASLSERRARAVAAFLKQNGVLDESIYYQGAGESLPVADNRTEDGRAANRRVEIIELADEPGFKKFLEARRPQYAYYRPHTEASASKDAHSQALSGSGIPKSRNSEVPVAAARTAPAFRSTPAVKTPAPVLESVAAYSAAKSVAAINFGGAPYSPSIAKIEAGSLLQEVSFSLISKAHADDNVLVTDCSNDRPRAVGAVKSLRDGRIYKTSEHLSQLYGKTWASDVNGNLVVINHLAILRGGGVPANLPELKVYPLYKPGSNAKPAVSEEPSVNSYLVDKGVLYRIFPKGDGGLKCMDVLFGTDGEKTAKAGKLIYGGGGGRYVADFKPQVQ